MKSSLYIKKAITILLVSGIFFSNLSFGNEGFGVKKTFVLHESQVPEQLKKYKANSLYLLYSGGNSSWTTSQIVRNDTILNIKKFVETYSASITGFRLIYENKNSIDSVWQVDKKYRLSDKAYNLGNNRLRILTYDTASNIVDQFIFDYGEKYKKEDKQIPTLATLLRQYTVYTISDRSRFSSGAVWILSIGIDKYPGGGISYFQNCESDAISYNRFFREQYMHTISGDIDSTLYHEYLLLGQAATRDAILNALKDIAGKSSYNDYFIFNYSGFSNLLTPDAANRTTYFYPYQETGYSKERLEKDVLTGGENNAQLISLKTLQEHIQMIQANNQLFISEAGPSEKFKTEFIKTLMQNSSAVASILNVNRVIIVPNGFGADDVRCEGKVIKKGPINYYITSLDSTYNIYNLFGERSKAVKTAFSIKSKEFSCRSFSLDYFDIFFEKQFLQEYKEIFDDDTGPTRGFKVKPQEMQQTISALTGKHYALVVGTDNYKGKGWNKLNNPIKDARAVAGELINSYGFEVQLLEDKPMDTIYKAIREYYRIAQPNDQLIVYFAGHGDVDDELLDDGFIVCNDSKSVDDDPVRNTYIPYFKLQKMLNNIPARQVLVLLDVCHGGTFDSKAFDKEKREGDFSRISNKNVLQFLKDKLPLRTRKFLSSVGSEPAFDGKAGRHSPFAQHLLSVLRQKGSGSNGIVTLSDINAVLKTASMSETATLKISPHMADFGNFDAFSEFIFIPVEREDIKER